jgi:uncharacterized damage-inducible protein DinB
VKAADLTLLFDYNYWATHRILNAAVNLSPEQLVAATPHDYGSLRGTLVHTLDAELGWRMRCQHNTSAPALSEAEFPTPAALAKRWREEEAEMRAYLATLCDDDLTRVVYRYTTDAGEPRERVLWHALLHIVNHGTHHRSEAATILTGYGHSPDGLDFTVFLRQT